MNGRGAQPPGERIQKVLAQAGLASRREAEAWIEAGRVTVNGERATLGQRVQGRDELRVDGRVVRRSRDASRLSTSATVFICHRSPGESLRDELIPRLPRRTGRRFLAVSPMPETDGGLELVTTDGALAERLQRHVRGWPTGFRVRVRGELPPVALEAIGLGELDDGRKLVIGEVAGSDEEVGGANRWYRVETVGASGKDIRRLVERQGALVSRVLRVSLGPLALTRDLNRGQFRVLEEGEAAALGAAGGAAPARASAPARRRSSGRPAASGRSSAPRATGRRTRDR